MNKLDEQEVKDRGAALGDARERERAERMANQGLTGQQIQAIELRHAANLQAIRRDIELRKLALDQACKLMASPAYGVVFEATPEGVQKGTMAIVRAMHAFLIEAAAEKAE